MNNLETKIKKREFYLAAIENVKENTSVNDVFKHFKELDYRHYVVYFTALYAFENCKSKNIAECGTAEGLSAFLHCQNLNKTIVTRHIYMTHGKP